MTEMLEQVLSYLNNWFVLELVPGTFTIKDGDIDVDTLQKGQYFRILGSVFNDGLYQYGNDEDSLTDETFDGAVWILAIPKQILTITKQIQEWQSKYGDVASSPYTSESFGGYSYTKGSNYSNGNDSTWQTKFESALAPYKKAKEMSYYRGGSYSDPSYRRPYNSEFPWG